MFRIIGDTIEYDRRPVAMLLDGLNATTMDRVESSIFGASRDVDAEVEAAVKEADEAHEKEMLDVTAERDEAIKERDALEETLLALEGGYEAHELVAEAKAEATKWREIAETNRKAYYDLLAVVEKRKARKPR